MISRSPKSWLAIAVGMVVFACIVLTVLSVLAARTPLTSVKVPGSNLTLVLYTDGKGLYRYNVTADGRKVSADTMLGARGALTTDPQISVLGDRVSITFHTSEHDAPFVEFDLAACRIVRDSTTDGPSPRLADCRRK